MKRFSSWDRKAGVGKHCAAPTVCRSVKKLLPGRAEPRSNWFKVNWNKEHTAGATD